MAEKETLELDLQVEGIVAGSKRAATSLQGVEKAARRAKESLSFGDQAGKINSQLDKIKADPRGFKDVIRAQRELGEMKRKLRKEDAQEGFFGSFTKALPFRSIAQYTQAAFAGELMAGGVEKIADTIIESVKFAVELLTEGVKKAFEEAGKRETLTIGENLSLGPAGGEAFKSDVERFAPQTGFTASNIEALLLPLRRAGLDQQATRTAFAAATDVAAGLGKGADEGTVSGLLDAFKEIKLRGGVRKRSLPGLGVDVKSFYGDLAKQLGVSVGAAEKMAEAGKIDPQQLLNTIYKAIEKRQGGQLGTGGEAVSRSFEARIAKLKNLPNEFFEQLANSPDFLKVSDAIGTILEKLDPNSPSGQRIMGSLNSMFSKIVSWFDDVTSPEGIDRLTAGIQVAVSFTQDMVNLATVLVDLFRQAASFATTITGPLTYLLGEKDKADKIIAGAKTLQDFRNASPEVQAVTAANLRRNDQPVPYGPENAPVGYVDQILRDQGQPTPNPQGGKSSKSVVVQAPLNVTIHANGDDETVHKIRRAAQDGAKHVQHALERSAQEAGG